MTSSNPTDPQSPATKPQGTLHDQEQTMEGEGQAATPGQEPAPDTDASDAPATPGGRQPTPSGTTPTTGQADGD